MQLNRLKLSCDFKTTGISSTNFRKTLIALTDNMQENDKKKIALHYTSVEFNLQNIRKIPYVLYARPYNKNFYIYSYNEDYALLDRIIKELKFSFSVEGKQFQLKNISLSKISIIPKREDVEYKTITPLLLFTGHKRKWLDWTLNNIQKNNLDTILKEKINKFLIDNVRYQMQQLYKNKEYKVYNEIELNWDNFKLIRLTIRDKTEMGIVGTFKSNYSLPIFIGHKIGLGYGQLAFV